MSGRVVVDQVALTVIARHCAPLALRSVWVGAGAIVAVATGAVEVTHRRRFLLLATVWTAGQAVTAVWSIRRLRSLPQPLNTW